MNINRTWNTLKVEKNGDFLVLSINRPTKLNALNVEVLSELKELLAEIKKDELFTVCNVTSGNLSHHLILVDLIS